MQSFKSSSEGRLDYIIANELQLGRLLVAKIIDQGDVLLNKTVCRKRSTKVRINDEITINTSPRAVFKTQKINLPVIYEDDDCIVIDKPSGILTHSKGPTNPEPTVASFISSKLEGLTGDRAGIVHRLDRATSGIIICAKNQPAHQWLQKQFSNRKVNKTYIAIINAGIKPKEAIIDMPIQRNPYSPKQFRVDNNGKPAQTKYCVKDTNDRYTMIILQPKTGRTHQLRVHLKQLGYPIIGDVLYGGEKYQRLMLHASELELTLPNKTRKQFFSSIPNEFKDIMNT